MWKNKSSPRPYRPAEKAGLEPGDGRFHRLLGRYRWSWEDGREMLPLLAQEALGAGPDAGDEIGPGLAVDETTDLKRGTACVSPQHSGVTGKTENCVTWVFSALVTATVWEIVFAAENCVIDPRRARHVDIDLRRDPAGAGERPRLALTGTIQRSPFRGFPNGG